MSKDRISVMPMLRRGVETKLGVQLAWAAQLLVLQRLSRDGPIIRGICSKRATFLTQEDIMQLPRRGQ